MGRIKEELVANGKKFWTLFDSESRNTYVLILRILMHKSLFFYSVIVVIVFVFFLPAYAQDFLTTPLGKEVVNLGLRFLDNPGDFVFNLHSDNIDFTPVVENRRGTIRTNFYPTVLPTTWVNLNLKLKVLSDGGYSPWIPQVDILGQYGRMLAIDIASNMIAQSSTESVKPASFDYTIGLIFTKAVQQNTRLYLGVNYSNATLNIKLDKPIEFSEFRLSELNVAIADYFIFTGIENKLKENKYVVAHLGYGLKSQKIVSRVAWYHKHLELGFNIYPEGLFAVHPFLAWHWYF